MQSSRLPRFQRTSEIPLLKLTNRDREILRYVFQHRFLRSTHLLSLTSGSPQQILRRLQLLYHHGYLDRPRAQIDYYRAGSKPMVYALGNKGMRLLEEIEGIPRRKLDWTAHNRTLTRFFMEHALAVSDVLVKLETGCRTHGIEFVLITKPVKWSLEVHHGDSTSSVGVVPDGLFGLKAGDDVRWFFMEADRGTMPAERTNLIQTSFLRKLVAYHETWRTGILKDSLSRFQVVTVTTSTGHMNNLIRANKRVNGGKGSGLFLFTERESFLSAENPLKLPLLNGRGEKVRLCP